MFLPGWFLLLAIFGKGENKISQLERFILSFGLGIVITDFIAFLYSKFNIPITALSSVLGIIIFCVICFGIYKLRKNPSPPSGEMSRSDREGDLFSFSKNQFILILLLLFLTIFIKTAFLNDTVAPTATDMGHHMYWVKQMAETHKLPNYEGMPDFIIGEHIIFGEIAMISGANFFSAFPVMILLLINILGILAVFILVLRIFNNKTIAILTLLFLGVLFAVASPQAKFVSGGVIGNIMGNFLMPLAFYFYYRAFNFSRSSTSAFAEVELLHDAKYFLSLAIFTTFGLFYTHHLTAFIFLFVFAFLVVLFLAVNYKDIKNILVQVSKIVFSPAVIATIILCLIFFFFIFTPNYIKTSAVETAVGAPSKITREGLSLTNLKDSVGEARMALGIIGFIMLVLSFKRKNFGFAIIAAWAIMIFVMSSFPNLLFINLPSSRIGNYLSYPLAILATYGLYNIFNFSSTQKFSNFSYRVMPQKFLGAAFLIILAFVFANGLSDSATAFKKSSDLTPMVQTFNASEYLKSKINADDIILKDHNYMASDSWIKLFFMQGYKYPQSRGYFKRYEDQTNPREMCTLNMISNPAGQEAQKCFSETGTDYIMVNPFYDSAQFKKLNNFDEVYNNGEVAVFYRK